MKRILTTFAALFLVLPALSQAEARTDVSLDFFYNNLSTGGNWVEVGDYGYCWQPTVAVSNRSWRPYADGYWAYTDVGWTWVSYEDFGWATYHYGRWTRLRDRGWFWVPGREWGPAWVSWRTGGDYVGWAPLPPRGGGEVVYEGRPITGQVDLEFDIGPLYYNFVDVRYIGEPVLRERIYAPEQNIGFMTRTVNVTNITYNNSMVYNYGPDYNTLSAYSTRPIQRLTLQRDASADLSAAAQSGALTKVQGDKLMVAAPLVLQAPAAPVAPKVVAEKIKQPTVEHGWSGVSDPKVQAELKQKMKTENPKNIPPPDIKPRAGAEIPAGTTMASPSTGAPAATPATPASPASPAISGSPAIAASPATPASPPTAPGKGKEKRAEHAPPFASPAATGSPGATPATAPAKGKNKPAQNAPAATAAEGNAPVPTPARPIPGNETKGKRKEGSQPTTPPYGPPDTSAPPGQSGAAPVAPQATQPPNKHKGEREHAASPPNEPNAASIERARGKAKAKTETHEIAPATAPQVSGAAMEKPKAERTAPDKPKGPQGPPAERERVAAPQPPAGQGPAKPEEGHGKPEKGKKKGEPTPVPGAPG